MDPIYQIHQVEDGKITVRLPEDFPTALAEIFIIPIDSHGDSNPEPTTGIQQLIQRLQTWDTAQFSDEQLKTYHRLCELLLQ